MVASAPIPPVAERTRRRIAQLSVPAAGKLAFSPFHVYEKSWLVVSSGLRGQVDYIPSHQVLPLVRIVHVPH